MYLQSLSLINFKNYLEADVEFSDRINCFTGDNGVGKTNILDAIYYLSFCKSSLNLSDNQNIRNNAPFFVIQGTYQRNESIEKIHCGCKNKQKKVFKRNDKEYEKLSEHIGFIPLVQISPSDSTLITGSSEERRKFLNTVISQFDKGFLDNLINYNRALNQRNVLLKRFATTGKFDPESLEIWDEQLIKYAVEIYQTRKKFIEDIIPVFQENYNHIAQQKETVSLFYQSQLTGKDYRELLKSSLRKDMAFHFTSTGIHRDDLELCIGNYLIRKNGSQGQQKTYLTALKLSQFEFIKILNGSKPLLLLDDIFDKLDSNRVAKIVELVADNRFGQIFITDTNTHRIQEILQSQGSGHKLFTIENDEIKLSIQY